MKYAILFYTSECISDMQIGYIKMHRWSNC